ncbi:hypothetical protein D6783_00595 [Candidatus Woesearchaeota archaeon]|nr:MAG: hypothetical protein D6783_00595 [Candidatus Woesearchaeota archaeon]
MDGIELCIRFSLRPTSLRFCGPQRAQALFQRYLERKDNEDEVRAAFEQFEGLYPYLSAIAQKHGRDVLDYDVVEAYWLGNRLLEGFTRDEARGIIEGLMAKRSALRSLPRRIGEALIESLPEKVLPHHNFHVFYVGVGRTAGTVPLVMNSYDQCRISWGEVLEVRAEKELLRVRTTRLVEDGGKVVLGGRVEREVGYVPGLLGRVRRGDFVALHWGFAPVLLREEDVARIEKYTRYALDLYNERAV